MRLNEDCSVKVEEGSIKGSENGRWTEIYTGKQIFPKGTKLYHFSEKKINNFIATETCFFTSDRGLGYCYIIVLENDMELRTFGIDEVRIGIDKNTEIKYIGKTYCKYDYSGNFPFESKIIDNRISI